eukprot:gb/GECG01006421.1/.p1 GENE.gb/GECG01006421.1/~~gb/GECG01006421.1/.p1  ORF type:complete len:118 (+),score=24.04 gb/GECG01006421.1/:1-354(+)
MKAEHPKAYANNQRKVERGQARDEYAVLKAAERYGVSAILGRSTSSPGRVGTTTFDSEIYDADDDHTVTSGAEATQRAERKSADDFAKIFDFPEDAHDWTTEVTGFTDNDESDTDKR